MITYKYDLNLQSGGKFGFGYLSFGPLHFDFTEICSFPPRPSHLISQNSFYGVVDRQNQGHFIVFRKLDSYEKGIEWRFTEVLRGSVPHGAGVLVGYGVPTRGYLESLDLIFVDRANDVNRAYLRNGKYIGAEIAAICELNDIPLDCTHWTEEQKAIIKLAL